MPGQHVPEGYELRRPRPEEAAKVQAVLDAAESFDSGEPRCHEMSIAGMWGDSRCRLDLDWWVIDHSGEAAAVAWIWSDAGDGDVVADHYVHPGHRGLGLGEILLDTIVVRLGELPPRREDGAVRDVVVWCEDSDVVRLTALGRRGWVLADRQYFEMAADLTTSAPPSLLPEGIAIRRFRPDVDDQRVHAADQEAFAEHFLFTPRSFEDWRRRHLEEPHADPTLWRLAWEGEELVGFVTALEQDDGGIIGEFAVRTAWRGRGVGRALLAAAFAGLRERGQTVARLYVDAQNVTGAVRVYEAAGMHVARRFDVLRKPLG